MASRREVAATVHGAYLVETATPPAAGLLVGFHGYGENAGRHLAELERIPGAERWHRAAVESLHRFYNSKTGEVVGSWMTKEGRELAIEDNRRYVAAVVAALVGQLGPVPRLVFAGFSQGVAMAYRAAAASAVRCHGLLALAGDVPPDVAGGELRAFPAVLIGRGVEDEWYTEEKLAADLAVLERRGVTAQSCIFDGGHEWSEPFRERAGSFLSGLTAPSGTPIP